MSFHSLSIPFLQKIWYHKIQKSNLLEYDFQNAVKYFIVFAIPFLQKYDTIKFKSPTCSNMISQHGELFRCICHSILPKIWYHKVQTSNLLELAFASALVSVVTLLTYCYKRRAMFSCGFSFVWHLTWMYSSNGNLSPKARFGTASSLNSQQRQQYITSVLKPSQSKSWEPRWCAS